MTRIRYTTPAGSQGEPHMRRRSAELVEEGVHRRAFVYDADSDVEALVRKRLVQRLDDFHCDPRVVRTPSFTGPTRGGTRVVLNDAPPLHAIAGARDSNPRDAVKAMVEATGLSPRPSVCGRPFCLNDVDGVNDAEGV